MRSVAEALDVCSLVYDKRRHGLSESLQDLSVFLARLELIVQTLRHVRHQIAGLFDDLRRKRKNKKKKGGEEEEEKKNDREKERRKSFPL